jgi:hypothetical protein
MGTTPRHNRRDDQEDDYSDALQPLVNLRLVVYDFVAPFRRFWRAPTEPGNLPFG